MNETFQTKKKKQKIAIKHETMYNIHNASFKFKALSHDRLQLNNR